MSLIKKNTSEKNKFISQIAIILVGILFTLIGAINAPTFYTSLKIYPQYYFLMSLSYFGLFLILFGIVQIIKFTFKMKPKIWKLLLGWLFYISGSILFFSSIFPLGKKSFFFTIIGIILGIFGLIFIYFYIKEKLPKEYSKIRYILNNLGGIILVLGIVGLFNVGYNPLWEKIFYIFILVGILIYVVSFIWKNLKIMQQK